MSRHDPHVAGGLGVATGFDVATQFGQGGENLYRNREFSVATELARIELSVRRPSSATARVAGTQYARPSTQQVRQGLCRYRDFSVVTDLSNRQKKK